MGNCGSSAQFSSPPTNNNSGTVHALIPEDRANDPVTPSESKRGVPELNKSSTPPPKAVEDYRHIAAYGKVNVFTYTELRAATKNFLPYQIIGQGGFGVVYKGAIDDNIRPGFDHTKVAVKVLNPDGYQGDREWLAEVNYLGQFSHTNLVKLIGYCCEDEHRLLVYEYMAQGCLERHLFRHVCVTMPWPTRIKIALGAAKGLAFLHGAERPVIYRDFKTPNILLDEDYNAKLSDFGLAKEGPTGDQTHVSTRVMGTHGYAAPEYIMTGHLTARSDVYGYGVVLLEMLIGRRATDMSKPSREHNLVEWARPLLVHNKKLLKIIDPRMEGQYTVKTLQKVAKLAYQCLSQNPKGRPAMSQVVEILESFQDMPEFRDDLLLLQNAGGPVTLYEVPRDALEQPLKEKRCPSNMEGESVESKVHRRRRRRTRGSKRRSKSEPSIEYVQQSPPPDCGIERETKFSSTRNDCETLRAVEDDVYKL